MKKIVTKEFLANDTFTIPSGVTKVIVYGLGGGAGGYAGGAGSVTVGGRSGPAGISCAFLPVLVTVTPNTTYTITIGAGGAGGASSTSGTDAVRPTTDGGDTSFGSLAVFKGAVGSNTGGQFATTIGVTDRSLTTQFTNYNQFVNAATYGYANGSDTVGNVTPYASWYFEVADYGTASGLATGGARGKCGSSSALGLGGTGGNGGEVAGPVAATAGGNAAANSGAGGGAGGGSAASAGANLPSGAGGTGGSGRLKLVWFE